MCLQPFVWDCLSWFGGTWQLLIPSDFLRIRKMINSWSSLEHPRSWCLIQGEVQRIYREVSVMPEIKGFKSFSNVVWIYKLNEVLTPRWTIFSPRQMFIRRIVNVILMTKRHSWKWFLNQISFMTVGPPTSGTHTCYRNTESCAEDGEYSRVYVALLLEICLFVCLFLWV